MHLAKLYFFLCYVQSCGNIEPIAGHFDLFHNSCPAPHILCSLNTVQFQFTRELLDNVLYDWLFLHH